MFNINVAHQKLKESDKIVSLPYYPKTQSFDQDPQPEPAKLILARLKVTPDQG